jgi:hypothetical protein
VERENELVCPIKSEATPSVEENIPMRSVGTSAKETDLLKPGLQVAVVVV